MDSADPDAHSHSDLDANAYRDGDRDDDADGHLDCDGESQGKRIAIRRGKNAGGYSCAAVIFGDPSSPDFDAIAAGCRKRDAHANGVAADSDRIDHPDACFGARGESASFRFALRHRDANSHIDRGGCCHTGGIANADIVAHAFGDTIEFPIVRDADDAFAFRDTDSESDA